MHEFDEDTQIEASSPGHYRARVTDRWNIGTVPNGGYVMSIGMRALGHALALPDPLSVTGHFVRPAVPGELSIQIEVVKRGRRYSTAVARLVQNDKEVLVVLGTFGDLTQISGPTHIAGAPPAVPALGDELPRQKRLAEIAERFEHRFAPETVRFMDGERSNTAEVRGALRFRDRRMPDTLSLGLIADACPPPIFNLIERAWVPTLELTVHVRARPATEWLHAVFRTRFVFGGLFEEDGEIWDENGTLVAQSRQLAAVPR